LRSVTRAAEKYEQLGKLQGRAQASALIAACHTTAGDFPAAADILLDCLAIVEAIGDLYGQACVLRDLGSLELHDRRHDAATYLDRCLALCDQLGLERVRGAALSSYGRLYLRRGDRAIAERYLQESARIVQR
jgi:tetratricopeptide (TPR) repeat protein